jgi:hypothetical protein
MTGTRTLIFSKHHDNYLTVPYRDALMEECVRMMQQSLKSTPTMKKRAKSVYQQRNLGTIKERKKEKREEKEANNGETIMQILRMRSDIVPLAFCYY